VEEGTIITLLLCSNVHYCWRCVFCRKLHAVCSLYQHSTESVWLLVWCRAEDKHSCYGINALSLVLQSASCALVATSLHTNSFVTCEYAAWTA